MTDIRELLDEATRDIVVESQDAADRIRQGLRSRRRNTLAVIAIVVAVAAATAVPLSLSGGGTRPISPVTPTPSPQATSLAVLQHWAPGDGEVAAGFGAVWGLRCCYDSKGPRWVDKLDPVTGRQLERIPIPGPASEITAGAGRVWTTGSTDGSGLSPVSAIDPRTARVTTVEVYEPSGIAIADGSAWVTFDLTGKVWRLTPTSTGMAKTVLDLNGTPDGIATTGNGQLWVSLGGTTLAHIVVDGSTARVGETARWAGDILSAAGPAELWAIRGPRTLVLLNTAFLVPVGGKYIRGCTAACAEVKTLTLEGSEIDSAISTTRGLFVSVLGSGDRPEHTDFFSTQSLSGPSYTPTAQTRGGGTLAPDGNGVVIGGGHAGLIHWVPPR